MVPPVDKSTICFFIGPRWFASYSFKNARDTRGARAPTFGARV